MLSDMNNLRNIFLICLLRETKVKISKLDSNRLENYCTVKQTANKMKCKLNEKIYSEVVYLIRDEYSKYTKNS